MPSPQSFLTVPKTLSPCPLGCCHGSSACALHALRQPVHAKEIRPHISTTCIMSTTTCCEDLFQPTPWLPFTHTRFIQLFPLCIPRKRIETRVSAIPAMFPAGWAHHPYYLLAGSVPFHFLSHANFPYTGSWSSPFLLAHHDQNPPQNPQATIRHPGHCCV
jgi:hypothetical protein